MSREDEIRARLDAAEKARRDCDPEKHGGPRANYSPVFIANAFAKHAPGNENDPELKEVWWTDAVVMHHAPDDLRWLLAEVDHWREEAIDAAREGFGDGVEWAREGDA